MNLEWAPTVYIVGAIFLAGGFYVSVKQDMTAIKKELLMLRETVAQIAVQNTRLDNQDEMLAATQKRQERLEERIYDMQRGRGFIKQEIDGEYPKSI